MSSVAVSSDGRILSFIAASVVMIAEGVKGGDIASSEAFETWDLRSSAEAERRERGEGEGVSPFVAVWVLASAVVGAEREEVNCSQSARVVSRTRIMWVVILSVLVILSSALVFRVDLGLGSSRRGTR